MRSSRALKSGLILAAVVAGLIVVTGATKIALAFWPSGLAASLSSPPLWNGSSTTPGSSTQIVLAAVSRVTGGTKNTLEGSTSGTSNFAQMLVSVYGLEQGVAGSPYDAQGRPIIARLVDNVQVITDNGTAYNCSPKSALTNSGGRPGAVFFDRCPVAASAGSDNYARSYWVKVYAPSGYYPDSLSAYGRGIIVSADAGGQFIAYKVTLHRNSYKTLSFWFVKNTNPSYPSPPPTIPVGGSQAPPDDKFNAAAETSLNPSDPGNSDCSVYNSILCYINKVRRDNNVAPITRIDPRLQEAARRKSAEMALKDYFSHDDFNGVIWTQMLVDVCFVSDPCTRYDGKEHDIRDAGQDLGAGKYATPESIVMTGQPKNWVTSPAHFREVIEPIYNSIGIGVIMTSSFQGQTCPNDEKCIMIVTADFGKDN